MNHFFVKKLRFLELSGCKRVPIDDLGGQNLLPILDFESMATKGVSHFSGLSLTFLFVKWGSFDSKFLIRLKLDFDLIFRFYNVPMVICWHEFTFVTHAMQKRFFFFLQFFFFKKKNLSISEVSYSALFLEFLQDLGIEEYLYA